VLIAENMSDISSKRVTFSDKGDSSRLNTCQKSPVPVTKRTASTKSSSAKEDGDKKKLGAAQRSGQPLSSSSETSTKNPRPVRARKSLVRNSNFNKPRDYNFKVTRPSSKTNYTNEDCQSKWSSNYPPSSLRSSSTHQQPLSIPIMQSNLDTARKMKALSEMSLETAVSQNKDLEIDQDDLTRKVYFKIKLLFQGTI